MAATPLGDELMNKIFGHGRRKNTSKEAGPRYGLALSAQEARPVVERVRSPSSLAHLRIGLPK